MGSLGRMSVGLLGPVVLYRDEAAVGSQSSLLRTALSLLALEADAVVSASRLIEELWGAELPRDPRSSLQVVITRLRRWLSEAGMPDDALLFQHGGYRLAIEPEAVDVHQFETACDEAASSSDSEQRLTRSEAGLALWRSEPFTGCAGSVRLEIESVRLGEIRLQLIESRLECLCQLGRYAPAVAELSTFASDYPARERFTWLLMLALYRQGRQREALAAFESTRRRLAEEFGLMPGPELVELETKILDQSRELDPASPRLDRAASPVPSRPLLVGREKELQVVKACLERADRGTVVVVTGEAGSGKSTLLKAVAHDVANEGAVVAIGQFDGDQAPLAGWVTALASIEIELPSNLLGAGGVAQSMLNHLAVRAQGRRTLVILEDVHAADRPSLALLIAIARRDLPAGLCIAASARVPDLSPRPEWSAAHADIAMTGSTEQVPLGDLTQEDVLRLAEQRLAHLGEGSVPVIANRLWDLTSGHPLHLSTLISSMANVETLDECMSITQEVPQPLAPLFHHQISTLPSPTRGLIEALAVSRSASLEDLAFLCEISPVGAANDLRPGLDVGMVVQRGNRLELRHALARTAVLERIALPTRQQLSWTMLQLLEQRGADPFEALRLSLEAGPLIETEQLGRIQLQAGKLAHQRGAFDQAAELLASARDGLDGSAAAEATVYLGMSLAELGHSEEADRLFDEVIEAEPDLDVHLQVLAAVGDFLGIEAAGSPTGFRRAERVLERTAGLRTRDRFSVLLGTELMASALAEPMGSGTEELAELAHELDDPLLILRAIHAREYAGLHVPPMERLTAAEQAYEHSTGTGDTFAQISSTQSLLRACVIAGEPERINDLLWEHRRLADRSGRRYARWFSRTTEAGLLDAAGDKNAEGKAREALDLGADFGIPDALGTYGVHILFSKWLSGSLGSALELIDQAVGAYPKISAWRAAAAAARVQAGRRKEASDLLAEFIETRENSAAKLFDLPGICLAATVATDLRDREAAAVLLQAIPRDSVEFVVAGGGVAAVAGPLPLFVALLELTCDDTDSARRHQVAARELCVRMGWSPWISACVFVEEHLMAAPSRRGKARAQGPYPLGLIP